MPKKTASKKIQPRLRISWGREIALGPGKAELLDLVRETGSITAAAGRMGMSYMRAWTLIRTMNRSFRKPVVVAVRGGSRGGGGAELTDTGRRVLALYQEMQAGCLASVRREWKQLRALLRA